MNLPHLGEAQAPLHLDLSVDPNPGEAAACCGYVYRLRHAGRWLRTGRWHRCAPQPRTLLRTALLLAADLVAARNLDPLIGARLQAWTTALPTRQSPALDDVTVVDGHRLDQRALITIDPYADSCRPCGDALAPALLTDRYDVALAEGVHQPRHPDRILAAWRQLGSLSRFRRYLAIFHGTTALEVVTVDSTRVVVFDTSDFRTATGADPQADLSGDAAMWHDWLHGDVYTVTVQTYDTVDGHDPRWHDADSVSGVLGHNHAVGLAADLLASQSEQNRHCRQQLAGPNSPEQSTHTELPTP
ncbi:hypothetical protein [Catellatospora methionotrophica]|uniref:hypothetical protein n=1 Tax=Catellatospora methionotrophica TaxID=121620 RepID=UPI0033DDBA50